MITTTATSSLRHGVGATLPQRPVATTPKRPAWRVLQPRHAPAQLPLFPPRGFVGR